MGFNLKSILPYLAGAGASGVSSQFSALAPFSAAIGAGAGALADKKNPLGGAAAGFAGGGVGSTLAGGIKNSFSTGTGNLFDKFGSGAMTGLKSYGNSIPGFGGVGTANPTGAFAKFFSPGQSQADILKNGTSLYKPNTAGTGYNPTAAFNLASEHTPTGLKFTASPNGAPSFTPPSSPFSNFANTSSGTGGTAPTGSAMNMFKSLIPGAAVAGIGSLLSPTPPAPDYSGVMNQFQNQIQTGGDPEARQAAKTQFLSTLAQPNGASAESAVANAKLINDRQKADSLKQIQDQFSANNGSLTGNSAYDNAVTKSNAAYDQNYAAQASQAQFQADQFQAQQKQAAATALSGMDDTQLQYYAGLAGLSVQQIQDQFQLDAGRAQGLKDIATQAGGLMMEKGLGLNGGAK